MGYRNDRVTRRGVAGGIGAVVFAAGLAAMPVTATAQSGEPIKIGFSMALTGPLAPNGKQALLGAEIWQEEINAKGGLLGRKVELVHYDDQSSPANVPGIYTKLIDVDKVDIVMGPYGTNLNAPAMPIVIQKNKVFVGFFALDINAEFHYPRYFSMLPTGPKPREAFTEGFSRRRRRRNPSRKPLRSPPRTPSSHVTRATAPAKMPRPMGSRSSTTRPSRPGRPTSRRSSARCRPPTPISSSPARIR